jgi:D-arabinono-1,4-lactone oxidase
MQIWDGARLRPQEKLPHPPYVQVPGGRPAQTMLALYFRWANAARRRTDGRARWMRRIARQLLPLRSVRFSGPWFQTVPMDNEIDNDLLPTAFSELWIDLDLAHEVGDTLVRFYVEDVACGRAGSFACELYGAKRSRFWLSPSYERDSIRVDLMHIERGAIQPEADYFPQFWTLLSTFAPRYHWGKVMPPPGACAGGDYFRRVFPRWDDFLDVRSRMDPDGVFLSPYWRGYLE